MRNTSTLFFLAALSLTTLVGCTLFATRPVQEMSDTAAAIKAAKEVQADVLAPELYRKATESFYMAKKTYKYKEFSSAKKHAELARKSAERAEYEALKKGGVRAASGETDPFAGMNAPPPPPPAIPSREPYEYPKNTGTPASTLLEQEKARLNAPQQQPAAAPSIPPPPGP